MIRDVHPGSDHFLTIPDPGVEKHRTQGLKCTGFRIQIRNIAYILTIGPFFDFTLTPFKSGWTVKKSTWCVDSVGCSELLFGIRDKMERNEEIKCQ
jgi:hypothetical protein